MVELEFLPKRSILWLLWIGLLLMFFPKYYSSDPFPELIYRYNQMWTQPCEVPVGEKWSAYVRAPRFLADFTDVPMTVSVINRQTIPDNAVVAVNIACDRSADCKDKVIVKVTNGELEQSTISLAEIPPNGVVTTQFKLRVVPGRADQAVKNLVMSVSLNGEDILQRCGEFRTRFDRELVFQLWVTENLLSPPGSNVVVPIFLLLIVLLAEIVAEVTFRIHKSENCREFKELLGPGNPGKGSRSVWLSRVFILVFAVMFVVFLAITFSDQWLIGDFRRWALRLVIGAIVSGFMVGYIAGTIQKLPQGK